MRNAELTKLVKEIHELELEVLASKGIDYSFETDDRLSNFKEIAEFTKLTPKQVLLVLVSKHIFSLRDHIASGRTIGRPFIREKGGDISVYMKLLEALVVEEVDGTIDIDNMWSGLKKDTQSKIDKAWDKIKPMILDKEEEPITLPPRITTTDGALLSSLSAILQNSPKRKGLIAFLAKDELLPLQDIILLSGMSEVQINQLKQDPSYSTPPEDYRKIIKELSDYAVKKNIRSSVDTTEELFDGTDVSMKDWEQLAVDFGYETKAEDKSGLETIATVPGWVATEIENRVATFADGFVTKTGMTLKGMDDLIDLDRLAEIISKTFNVSFSVFQEHHRYIEDKQFLARQMFRHGFPEKIPAQLFGYKESSVAHLPYREPNPARHATLEAMIEYAKDNGIELTPITPRSYRKKLTRVQIDGIRNDLAKIIPHNKYWWKVQNATNNADNDGKTIQTTELRHYLIGLLYNSYKVSKKGIKDITEPSVMHIKGLVSKNMSKHDKHIRQYEYTDKIKAVLNKWINTNAK